MNLENLMAFAITIVIGMAAIGNLDKLQQWVWRKQAQVIYESRTSTWGSPRIFPKQNQENSFRPPKPFNKKGHL